MADAAVDTVVGTAVEHKRATVRPDKSDAVAELARSFTDSSAAVLTEYRGLTVRQISELRRALGAETTYSVVKNTLTRIAARAAGLTGLDELLSGPTAVAFVTGDPVAAAKGLRDYARTNPALVVKGGVMDGRSMTADEIRRLADLESREVLLGKLAGALKGSLTQAVYLFAAPLAQAARAVGALEAKAQQDPSVLGGGAGTPDPAIAAAGPAADTAPADTAPADTAPADTAPADTAPADTAPADTTAEVAETGTATEEAPAADASAADSPVVAGTSAAQDAEPAAAAPAADEADEAPLGELADQTLAAAAERDAVPHPADQSAPAGVIAHEGSADSPVDSHDNDRPA